MLDKELSTWYPIYAAEHQRRMDIEDLFGIPMALILALSGGLLHILSQVSQVTGPCRVLLGLAVMIPGYTLYQSAYHLARGYIGWGHRDLIVNGKFGWDYKSHPNANDLLGYIHKIREEFSKTTGYVEAWTYDTFKEYLCSECIKNADHCAKVNDQRAWYLYQSKYWLLVSVATTTATFFLITLNALTYGR